MSKIEIKPFEEQIRIAGIAGELERAEDNGYANGLEEGHSNGLEEGRAESEKIISKLLLTHTAEEISAEYGISIERILEIKNDNG